MSARTFMRRWNVRVLRREWRQYVVIFVLMVTGVTLSIGGVLAAYNLVEPPESEFGNGRFAAWTDDDPAAMAAALEQGGHSFSTIESATVTVTGTSQRIGLRVIDPGHPVTAPLVTVLAGRVPQGAGEVAVTDRAVVDVGLSDTVTAAGQPVTVVGLVENPTDLDDEFVMAASLAPYEGAEVSTRFLVDADPGSVQWSGVRTVNTASSDGPSARTAVTLVVNVVSAFGMLEIGLLVGAGFAVISRRRMRQFGLLAAAGATPAQLRSAATGVGLLLGVVAAACGAVIGVGATWLLLPRMEEAVGHRIAFDVPPWAVIVNVALAIAIAAIAARWPSRMLTTQPVANLLSAQRPRRERVGLPAVIGVIVACAGVLALAAGFARLNMLLAVVGVLAAPIGFLLMAPLVVGGFARIAGRLRLAPRLAGRAVGRHNRRSAAVVAALALALAVPIGLVVVTASIDARRADQGPNLAENWFAAWLPGADGNGTRIPAALDGDVLSDTVGRISEAAPDLTLTPIEVATVPDGPREIWDFDGIGPRQAIEPVLAGRPGSEECLACDTYGFSDLEGEGSVWIVDTAWVATPELLTTLGIEADLGAVSAVSKGAEYRPVSVFGPLGEGGTVAVGDGWPRNARVPDLLVSPDLIETADLDRVAVGVLASAEEPITLETRDLIRQAVGPDLVLEFHEPPPKQSGLRAAALSIGIALAVGIALAAVSLFTVELSADLEVLESIGAPPQTTRKLGGAMAGIVASAGALLALLIGYVALVPLVTAEEPDFPFVSPWRSLVALLVVFPGIAVAAGWLFARPGNFGQRT